MSSTVSDIRPSARTTSFGVALPRWAVVVIGAVLLATLSAVAVVRLGGTEIREPDAAAVKTRALRFEDRSDGSVAVIDHLRGDVVAELSGEQASSAARCGRWRASASVQAARGPSPSS